MRRVTVDQSAIDERHAVELNEYASSTWVIAGCLSMGNGQVFDLIRVGGIASGGKATPGILSINNDLMILILLPTFEYFFYCAVQSLRKKECVPGS